MERIGGRRSVEGLLIDWSMAQPLPDRRLPVGLLSREQKAAELQRVQARRAMDAAYEAELVLGLADDTPDTLDPPADHPGARRGSWAPDAELPGVSEFFTAELAVVLGCGRGTAAHLAARARTFGRTCRPPGRRWPPAAWTSRGPGCWPTRCSTRLRASPGRSRPPCCPRRATCRWAGCAPGRWRCCWSSTPTPSMPGAARRSGPPTCAPTPRTWRA